MCAHFRYVAAYSGQPLINCGNTVSLKHIPGVGWKVDMSLIPKNKCEFYQQLSVFAALRLRRAPCCEQ